MLDTLTEERVSNWNQEIRTYIGVYKPPMVRCNKRRNAECSNTPFLRICPGVDEPVKTVPRMPVSIPSRQNYLVKCAGQADKVFYLVYAWEDMSLLRPYNFLKRST